MPTMTVQMSPPRNSCGVVVIRLQISASLSFQVLNADCRFPTIQLSLKRTPPFLMQIKLSEGPPGNLPQIEADFDGVPLNRLFFRYATPMADKISFAKAMISPPNTQRIPWVRWLASWD